MRCLKRLAENHGHVAEHLFDAGTDDCQRDLRLWFLVHAGDAGFQAPMSEVHAVPAILRHIAADDGVAGGA